MPIVLKLKVRVLCGKCFGIISGQDIQFNFFPVSDGPPYVGYAYIDEGKYVNGKWTPGRRLNGDDIMLNYHLADEAALQKNGQRGALPFRWSEDLTCKAVPV